MVPHSGAYLRFAVQLKRRTALFSTAGEVEGVTFGGVWW